jgi:nucleotide-binding universal stress UspA family protein
MPSLMFPLCWPWAAPPEPPPPDAFAGKLIILASEGRPIPQAATKFVKRMAERAGAEVHVLSIARIWGTSFGLPNPGLLPNKREMKERYDHVEAAVTWLKRHNIAASGQVTGTRNAAKLILAEARRRRADAIVMAADPLVARAISRPPAGLCPRLFGGRDRADRRALTWLGPRLQRHVSFRHGSHARFVPRAPPPFVAPKSTKIALQETCEPTIRTRSCPPKEHAHRFAA